MTDEEILSILKEIIASGAQWTAAQTKSGGREVLFERDSTLKALGLDEPTHLFRHVIDQALANLKAHSMTTEAGAEVVLYRFLDLAPAVFTFSPHPAAKRWYETQR